MTTPTLSPSAVVDPPASVAGEAARLTREAAAAAQLRTWRMYPDVVALRVERIRTQVDRLMWAGITAGLCFTMTNVQQFAAAGAAAWSLAWCAAWLLDPMVSMVLLAVLRAEQVITRYQVSTGVWPRVTKWALLSAMYGMNTWSAWAVGSASRVVLHSVPPLVVVLAAEAVTDLQYALTECVHRAHAAASAHAAESGPRPVEPTPGVVGEASPGSGASPLANAAMAAAAAERPTSTSGERPAGATGERPPSAAGKHLAGASGERLAGSAGEQRARGVNPTSRAVTKRVTGTAGGSRQAPRGRRSAPAQRKFLADYVAEARAAWTPGVVVTPAWVRQVTDCSRGLSSKVAATMTADPVRRHHTTAIKPEGRAA